MEIIIVTLIFMILLVEETRIKELNKKLEIKTSENLSLKRVLAENDLIPERYVK